MRTVLFLSMIGLMLISCSRDMYKTTAYDKYAKSHKTLAVLPFEIIFTGTLPKKMTEEDQIRIERAESIFFQESLFHQLAKQSGTRNKDVKIILQSTAETNRKLEEAGLSIRESWDLAPTELAEILEVDAVLDTKIYKARYMSDLASLGVDIGRDLLAILTNNPWTSLLDDVKAGEVDLNASVLDGDTGMVVWALDQTVETDWDRSDKEVVEDINRKISRKFPYRE